MLTNHISRFLSQNLDERLQSLVKAAFFSVKPPPSGPRKKAKLYPPLEAYLRNMLLVRLEVTEASVSATAKQLVRLPWNDPAYQCGALLCRLLLKACRRGRYKTIEAVALVAAKLRTQRVAGEVTVRLVDAVLEELRWALDNPNFRDQQRIIVYARLLGELYRTNQVAGSVVIDQLYDFINLGHEIPEPLREASKKLVSETISYPIASDADKAKQLPVYNSASGVSQAIQEDEEMEEAGLETNVENPDLELMPVAVSTYSKYDPRVFSTKDPPNSSYRITLVCTLLEVTAKNLVSKNNLPRLRSFLAAFQRYLFTKTLLPTDVEFVLLDTFDIIDSQWKRVTKPPSRGGAPGAEGIKGQENGFPRYITWIDAHDATVGIEQSEALFEKQKRARLEEFTDETKSLPDMNSADGHSINDEDMHSLSDEEDGSVSVSMRSENEDETIGNESAEEEDHGHWASDEEGEGVGDGSEGNSDEDEDEEDEDDFDEEAYMRQLEEEAFERELRRMTMEALEKGKNTSRKQVGDNMISGSQIVKKKLAEASKASDQVTSTALGGAAGITFQLLKKGNKGKVEAKEFVVPSDTNLALVASRKDDRAARERDVIKQRVLRYEEQSAESELAGGNVYLEQDRLQRNKNRPLSMDVIDRNFGTTGGNLSQAQLDKKKKHPSSSIPAGRGGLAPGRVVERGGPGGGSGRGRGGRNPGGRTLFG
jgi:regulator of nonsense transcripts 2